MIEDWDPEPSFDPRSWVSRAPEPAPSPPPIARALTGTSSPPPARPPRLVAAVVGGAILAVGAVAAYVSRPDPVQPVAVTSAPLIAGTERRTLLIPDASGIAGALVAIGIADSDAQEAARLTGSSLEAGSGEVRLDLAFTPGDAGARLRDLAVTRADGAGVQVTAAGAGQFRSARLTAHIKRQLVFVRGELDGDSFYSSAVAAGVNDALIGDFANAFRYDFDMQREVARGDVFEAGFEQRIADSGEPIGLPVLVYAALSTATKARALYRYAMPDGPAEWFDAGGRSSRRSLMRTPVEAARISSGFGMRGHPILGFVKMHRGTDFAAPTGTPIFAAGDAVVEFAGPKGPNGNFVKLRHHNGWETLYLHMSHIADGMALGVRVAQGQQIGAVGTTGRSTGPHLHYEVHINGVAVDPMSIETGTGRTLTGPLVAGFRKARNRIDAGRAGSESL